MEVPPCSKAISAEHRPTFAALYRHWWSLYTVKYSRIGRSIKKFYKPSICLSSKYLYVWFCASITVLVPQKHDNLVKYILLVFASKTWFYEKIIVKTMKILKKNLYKIKINFDCVVTDFLSNRENSSRFDTLKSLYQKKLSKWSCTKTRWKHTMCHN